MEFSKRTYLKLATKAGRRQDRLWRAYNKFQRDNGYVDAYSAENLSVAVRFKERVYSRWWRERRCK